MFKQSVVYGSFNVKWTNKKTRPSLILFILGRLEVPREVWKTTDFHNCICCSFSLIALWMHNFSQNAIAKTLINQVVIDIEGRDKHEIEAFVKSFNLICLKTDFRKFSTSRSFKIFLKFDFFLKTYHFKILKKSPKLFIILGSHMERFSLGSECWKFGSLDMEWTITIARTTSMRYKAENITIVNIHITGRLASKKSQLRYHIDNCRSSFSKVRVGKNLTEPSNSAKFWTLTDKFQ
jgi:hypothetical protein